jgi:hypothetical protein
MSRSTIKRKSKNVVVYGDEEYTRQAALDAYGEVEELINEPREQKDGTFRSPSPAREVTRKSFRENSSVPESVIEAFFGTFIEYKRAVGKQPTRAQQTLNTQTARAAAVDQLRKVWQERLDYGSTYQRDAGRRHQIILGCNDLHDEDCDPFVRRLLIETAKRVQPDIIVSNGDHFDAPEFGKYPNDPREWDVAGRVNAGLEIFRDLREAAPNAQIDLIEGNHEARVIRHFTEVSPATKAILSDIHGMDLRKFLGLDRYEINYVAKADMGGAYTDANIKQEVKRNFRTYFDTVCAHHFPVGKQFAMAGWNGHHHSHHVQHFHNATFGAYEWHQFGSGHRRDATYTNGEKWATGFGLIHVDTVARLAQIEYIHVNTTFAVVGGQRYVREPEEFYDALFPMIDRNRVVPFPSEPPNKRK